MATAGICGPLAERVGLLDWLDDPKPERGVWFLSARRWERVGYDRLAAHVAEAASWVTEVGVRPGEVVALVLPNGVEFVAAYCGVLAAGGVPCPLPVPGALGGAAQYRDHLAAILRVARPALVLVRQEWAGRMREALDRADVESHLRPALLTGQEVRFTRRSPARHALLQFTSGSTGHPRGVQVTWDNIEANIAMIRQWVAPRLGGEPERVATWLPFHHDMGLIGALLAPVSHQVDVHVLRPDQFLRDPLRWLECFGRFGATMGGAPCFGYAYLARRLAAVAQAQGGLPADLSLSSWRVAVVGADRIQPAVLAEFTRRCAPIGFRPEAFLAAYGLAEATLAVSGGRLDVAPTAVRIDWRQMRQGRPVRVVDRAPAHTVAADDRGWVVSCGRPHPQVTVDVVDQAGDRLPPGHLGEIRVSGACVADGYRDADPQTCTGHLSSTEFTATGLRTGDAGLLLDGEVYVIGRIADSVKIRGRSVYAEDVEDALYAACGLRPGSCVVLGGVRADGPVLVALVENDDRDLWPVATQLARVTAGEVDLLVLRGRSGCILRTSSGKPRRRVMWERLLTGDLRAEVVHEHRRDTAAVPLGELG